MIRKFFEKIFYDPYRLVKKFSNITMGENVILLKSCKFRFENQKKKNFIKIGKDSMLGCTFVFESNQGQVIIGKNCYIGAGTNLISRSSIEIGNNVTIAWGCTLYDHNSHSLNYKERQKDIQRQNEDYRKGRSFIYSKDWNVVKSKPIVIEDNVWIGFDSVILAGVTVGEGAIIGARSVVRKDVEPWTVVVGNPAIIIKRLKKEHA